MKLYLTRNLRKKILQGDPWIYADSLKEPEDQRVGLASLYDAKKDFLAWGIYDPKSPLRFRVLSLYKQAIDSRFLETQIQRAYDLRSGLRRANNNAYRLFHGEGDQLAGLICDIYNSVAVLQVDGDSMLEFWDLDLVADFLLAKPEIQSVYLKPRKTSGFVSRSWGVAADFQRIPIFENGYHFLVDCIDGQKTGFFLDQRENRRYVSAFSKGRSVLNLFSYTGGFSIYAGAGGADRVQSLDLSAAALERAEENWRSNHFSGIHEVVSTDIYEYLAKEKTKWDLVICDPPSMAKSESQKRAATEKYIEIFSAAAKLCKEHLFLSSCSSHISFSDFEEIITLSLSKARRRAQVLQFCSQGFDHPYLHIRPEFRYLKFVHLRLD